MENMAYIFDMDGTLVDNMKYHYQAWVDFFIEKGKEISITDLIPLISGKPSDETIRITFGENVPPEIVSKYVAHKEELYRESYAAIIEPLNGLMDFLQAAKKLNIPMAVATSSGQENIDFTIDGLNLREYFAAIIGSEGIKNGKPDPEIFLTAAKRLGIPSDKCLVFEDSIIGVEAASRANMKIVALTTTVEAGEFKKFPSVIEIVKDFRNITPNNLRLP
jgi:beta-phosphoglucomutase family hydrolase